MSTATPWPLRGRDNTDAGRRLDEDLTERAARWRAEVDRAVDQYRRRLEQGDWPTFTPPQVKP